MAGAVICVGVLVTAIARFEAGATPAQLFTFYVVPASGILFFAAAARAPDELRVNLSILTGATVVALYGAEAVFQLAPAPQQWEGVAAELGMPDTRSKLEVIRDLRDSGMRRAFPEYSPWQLRDLRISIDGANLVPIAPTPSYSTAVACNEGQGWIIYKSDEHGFRGHEPWPDRAEVVVVGDSFVAGRCVKEGEDIPGRLQRLRPSTRNLGVAGAGPLHELAVLKEYAAELRPAVVVWVYFEGNDLGDLRSEMASPLMTRYLVPEFELDLPAHQGAVDARLSHLLDSVYEARIAAEGQGTTGNARPELSMPAVAKEMAKLTRFRRIIGLGVTLPTAEPLGDLPDVIRLGRDAVRQWGGHMVLVYLPDYARFGSLLGNAGDGQHPAFLRMAAEFDIPVVDLVSLFGDQDDPTSLWVHPRGHLNPAGYRLAAAAIAEAIAPMLSADGRDPS